MPTITLPEILESPPGDFKPVAYYDKHMDCIRAELRDCSVTEVRLDKTLTVLRDNDPSESQSPLAGFMIKGVKMLFKEWGLPLTGVLMVTTILDRLLKELPIDCENVNMKKDIEHINTIAADIELSVNFSYEEMELAA
jgi:hypothetical protein